MIHLNNVYKWVLPVYRPYLQDWQTRFTVFYGGAGSGKSYFAFQKIIIKALLFKRKVLVVRKIGNTLRDSVWALFLELTSRFPSVIESVNRSEYYIKLINGSEFIFKGLDDPEKIKSIQGITDIVIEEATELTEDDFSQLNLRLRANAGMLQIYLMFNPVSKANWVYKHFFEFGTPSDCIIIHTTYKDNPTLPKEYVASMLDLEKRNPTYFKIYALGEFATLDKLIFPNVIKRPIERAETNGLLFWCGLDFGYVNDPTAINWGYVDNPNRKLFVVGEHDNTDMTNDVIARVLIKLGLSKEVIIADSAEPKSISEIKRAGINRIKPSVKGPDSVKNGIDRLKRYDIIVDTACECTCEEFDNYTWKKDRKTGEYVNEPIDMFNHHIDAIRYGTQDVMKKKTHSTEELASCMFL